MRLSTSTNRPDTGILQKTASAEETVKGKKAFEAMAQRQGIRIENYHADNGVFKAHVWVEACESESQGITYAGVNAHHQNGVAERRIRELKELARAMLIHANSRWKGKVTANFWPYAIRMASDAVNHTPSFQDPARRTPIEIFAGSKVASNPKHWKPLGARHTYWATPSKGKAPSINGSTERGQESTWESPLYMVEVYRWYWIVIQT